MKRLEENKIYNQRELFMILGISQYTWDKKRDEWLEYFKHFCEYEINHGARGVFLFTIKHILEEEYIPMAKNSKTKAEVIQKDYDQQVVQEIRKYSFQTVNTLSNRTQVGSLTAKYNHSDYTSKKYVRNTIKNPNLVYVKTKVWMRPNNDDTFTYLTEEELAYLKSLFVKYFDGVKQDQEDIYAGIENGEYSQEEGVKLAGSIGFDAYRTALRAFNSRYGYTPKKIPEYELNAFGFDGVDPLTGLYLKPAENPFDKLLLEATENAEIVYDFMEDGYSEKEAKKKAEEFLCQSLLDEISSKEA